MVRILMVGSTGMGNDIVVGALRSRGFQVEYVEEVKIPNPSKLRGFDVVYGTHLPTCSRYLAAAKVLRKKSIIHFVGSDAYRYAREKGLRKLLWETVVHACDLILYVSPHLMELVGRRGSILPLPIDIDLFKKTRGNISPERDTLYYCPGRGARGEGGELTYRLDWIVDYAKKHPKERITVIGNSEHPADYKVDIPNVEVIPFIPHHKIGEVYAKHKRLIRMTTEDGMPRMVHEALLCGLEVVFNGRRVTEVPPERDPKVFAKRFEEELQKIL